MTAVDVNRQVRVRRRAAAGYDAHGAPVLAAPGPAVGPWPAYAYTRPDGVWVFVVDPAVGPVAPGDVLETEGARWLVRAATRIDLADDPELSFVRVEAVEWPTEGGA